MADIEFDVKKHVYTAPDGTRIPSVTDIISPIKADGYSKINPAVLEHAAMKGTLVHEWCEMYDYGDAEDQMPGELVPYCQAYIDFVHDFKPEWWGIEQIVYFNAMPTGNGYAGTVDRQGCIHGKPCVVDIKTIASPGTKDHIAVCCQTAAYSMALGQHGGRYALYLKPDGTYKFMDCEEYETKHGFSGYGLFAELYHLRETINEIGETR